MCIVLGLRYQLGCIYMPLRQEDIEIRKFHLQSWITYILEINIVKRCEVNNYNTYIFFVLITASSCLL